VDPGTLGTPEQGTHVVRILEGVQHEDERWLTTLGGPGKDVVERREPTGLHDERDALVAVEPGERGERAALDLDDRDAQVRRMQDQLFERGATLRDDEQADGGPAGDERLLDRATSGDQLLTLAERVGRRQCRFPVARRRWPEASRPAISGAVATERRSARGAVSAVCRPLV
jgi:hypothetical protein